MTMCSRAAPFLLLPILIFGCAPRIQELPELDLTFFEHSSQYSRDSIIKYVEGRSLFHKVDTEVRTWGLSKFQPVFICGIPCYINFMADPNIKFFESFWIDSRFEFLEKFKDIRQSGSSYPTDGFNSRAALQDSLITRMKAEYGDWDHVVKKDGHYVPDSTVKLRTIFVEAFGTKDMMPSEDTFTIINLEDSGYYYTHLLK